MVYAPLILAWPCLLPMAPILPSSPIVIINIISANIVIIIIFMLSSSPSSVLSLGLILNGLSVIKGTLHFGLLALFEKTWWSSRSKLYWFKGGLFGKVGLWSSGLRRGFVAPSFCSNPLPLYVNSYPGFIWRPLFFTYFVVFHISPPLIVMAILNLISYTKCLKLFFF